MKYLNIKINPTLRISLGLIALLMGWMMLLQILIGILPDQSALLKQLRESISENLAIQSAVLLQSIDMAALQLTLNRAVQRNNQIHSVAIRKKQGPIVLQAGDHSRYWKPVNNSKSTLDFIRIELEANHQPWGDIEIAFHSASPKSVMDWIKQPIVLSLLLFIIGGLVLFSFYLRRVLDYLDPSSVIPDRVSVAFDSFTEGVMMVDPAGRIVLMNKVLRNWMGEKTGNLFGKYCKDVPWLNSALHSEPENYPWARAMMMQSPIKDWSIEFKKVNGESIKAVINCSPIQDTSNNIRGCLVTFDNITELDRINKELMSTMDSLNKSQQEIEKQNIELRKLATRDPMTSCLNRRAFFENADSIFAEAIATNRPISCIMSDIDHFKLFNDRYGHAVGDKVIIAVARALFSGLRTEDLLCRYGGEEFCILLPDATPEVAFRIAERLRIEIESKAGSSIRSTKEIKVTSSFGVVTLTEGVKEIAIMIEHADMALYAAKNAGRNRVVAWEEIEHKTP